MSKTYCEKWPSGCLLCDLLMCDGHKDTAGKMIEVRHDEDGRLTLVPKPTTNADRIRAMSDEELARFIAHYDSDTRASEYLAEKRWLDWLKEESE